MIPAAWKREWWSIMTKKEGCGAREDESQRKRQDSDCVETERLSLSLSV
jgi:hypothetical protein